MPLRSPLLASLCLCPLAAPAAAAVSFSSDAYDTGVHLATGNAVVADARTGAASGTADPAYANAGGVASVNQGATLASNLAYRAAETLTAGVSTAGASSAGVASNQTTATATVANAAFGLTNQLLGTLSLDGLLSLGATSLSSTTTVGIDGGGLFGTGGSLLTGLSLTGSLLGGSIDGSLYGAPAANTVLLSLAGLKLTLNEQIRSATADGLSLQTNAVHIAFNDYAVDGSVLNGDVILGHSAASVSGVPEPATWGCLVIGLGLVGAAMRRRQPEPRLA